MLKNGSSSSDSSAPSVVRYALAQREISWAAMMKVRDGWPFKVQATGDPHCRLPGRDSPTEPKSSSFVT